MQTSIPSRRPSRRRGLAVLAAAGALFLAGMPAGAQPEPDAPAAPPGPPGVDADILRGPTVTEHVAATLVQRDMAGKLVRIDTRPEQAALDVLGLSAEQRAAADTVLADRFAKVTQLMIDHNDLFLAIQAARQGGAKQEELAPLMRQFRPIAAPMLEKPLAEQVAAALPEEKRPEFTRIVAEYKQALLAEGPPDGQRPPEPPAGRGPGGGDGPSPERRLEVNLLLREMGQSLRAIVQDRKERTEHLLKTIEATPEQEAQITAILRAGGSGNGLRPTPEQRGAVWEKIMQVLTPEQRRKAMEERRGGGDK